MILIFILILKERRELSRNILGVIGVLKLYVRVREVLVICWVYGNRF